MAAGLEGEQDAAGKRKKWVRGQNSAISLLHTPLSFQQSLHCDPIVTCPRMSTFWFNLKHSEERARNDSQSAAAVTKFTLLTNRTTTVNVETSFLCRSCSGVG